MAESNQIVTQALLRALQSEGWRAEGISRVEGLDYEVDAILSHKDVADGRSLILECAYRDLESKSERLDPRQEAYKTLDIAAAYDLLIAYPIEENLASTTQLTWQLLANRANSWFEASVDGLAETLAGIYRETATRAEEEPDEETPAEKWESKEGGRLPGRYLWICQYRPGDAVTEWTREARPGSTIMWKTEQKSLPKAMRADDAVIYWRTIDPNNKKDRGGIVGTGRILSASLEPDESGVNRFPTEVQEFFDEDPISRDEAIAFANIERRSWRGAVLGLTPKQAGLIDELLQAHDRLSAFAAQPHPGPKIDGEDQIVVNRDDAQRDHDALGRAPLAISLAWMLHDIWCTEQGYKPNPERKPQRQAAGFVAHIDAPWGGGKSSFANLIARTLNPELDGKVPDFLKKRYPARSDMSGLFMSAAKRPKGLKDEKGKYLWDEEARRPWIIVPFNAWRNQHVDPPWWCFYQTIRKTCFAAIAQEGVPTVEQDKAGNYYTLEEGPQLRRERIKSLWLREIWWRLTAPKVTFQLAVAAISFVVAALILYFDLAGIQDKGKVGWTTSSNIGLVIAFLTGAGTLITAFTTVIADAVTPGRNVLGERIALGSADPLTRFRKHFSRLVEEVQRPILVIIDDIDRCEPQFIVELTRGLQTILTSPRVVYLLLGDRKWIEKAFESYHEDMNSIDVGPEHTFGGRFVEKAIQLSFILPGIGVRKNDYVEEVLQGPKADQPADDDEDKIDLNALRLRMSAAESPEEIDAIGDEVLKATTSPKSEAAKSVEQVVREELVLQRTAQGQEVEKEIRHRLQPLAPYLPENPRQIKRIINAISMYQNSLLFTEDERDSVNIGGERWRQLVVGVVLMIGYPKSWSILAKNPDWAEDLIEGDRQIKPGDYGALAANEPFVALLSETKLLSNAGTEAETKMNRSVVNWLNQIFPIVPG